MSQALSEHEIAERIVRWLTGESTRYVSHPSPNCSVCGEQSYKLHGYDVRSALVADIEEIIQEGLHS